MGVIFMIAAAALLIDQLTKMLVVGFFLDPTSCYRQSVFIYLCAQ